MMRKFLVFAFAVILMAESITLGTFAASCGASGRGAKDLALRGNSSSRKGNDRSEAKKTDREQYS